MNYLNLNTGSSSGEGITGKHSWQHFSISTDEVRFLKLVHDPIKGKSSCLKYGSISPAVLHAKSYKKLFLIKSLPGSLKFLNNGGPTRLSMLKGAISHPN